MQVFKELMKCTYPEVISKYASLRDSSKNNEKNILIQFIKSIFDN